MLQLNVIILVHLIKNLDYIESTYTSMLGNGRSQ